MRLTTGKRTSAVLLAAGLVLGLGACSDDGDDDAASDDAATETTEGGGSIEPDDGATDTTAAGGDAAGSGALTITEFDFDDITAAGGDIVQVVDETGAPHTVTSDDDAWEEASLDGNGTAEFTAPSEPGEYAFHCEIHPSMTGTLTVP